VEPGTLTDTNYNFTPVNGTLTVNVITPASLISLVGQLLEAGSIDNAGIANSLTSKLNAVAEQIAKGNSNAAINQLNALINELNAQDGKHMNHPDHELLEAGALYLINSLS
jgi:ABC-type transporter Mla subunit MlaD